MTDESTRMGVSIQTTPFDAANKKPDVSVRPGGLGWEKSTDRLIQSHITYELLEQIGQGGMGEVYKALLHTNVGLSEKVAIKTIREEFLKEGSSAEATQFFLQNFEKETTILSELNGHPNIVGFKGADYIKRQSGKTLFLVMEYIEGFDLGGFMDMHLLNPDTIAKGKAFMIPPEFIGFILFRIANALDYANRFQFSNGREGVVHLDISPGNVLLNGNLGLVKLADFGVAASLGDILKNEGNALVGKPSYVSPEVVNEGEITTTTDLYSLGIIMYEMMTGFNPNRVEENGQMALGALKERIIAVQGRELIPPHKLIKGVDERLSEIIVQLMEQDPDNRFSSALELHDVVGEAIYGKGFGPTDRSLAKYIAKTRLTKYSFGPYKRLNDEHAQKYVELVNASRKPVRLYRDARQRITRCGSPCRI